MKVRTLGHVFFLPLLVIVSCTYETGIEPDRYNVDVGTFALLEESLAMMPYQGETQVVFVDSLEQEIIFNIAEAPFGSYTGIILDHNVYEPGDTVRYHFSAERKTISLENDSLEVKFELSVAATPYFADLEKGYVADVTRILLYTPMSTFVAVSVFNHIVNQRTWPSASSSTIEHYDTLFVFNMEFHDVLKNSYVFLPPPSIVYFNYDVGIVSFTDHFGKRWRFERFL